MKRLGTKSVFLGIFLTLLLAGVAVAQTGSIQGTVTDKSGAVIQGAEITVSNGETNTVRTATTNGTGGYSFPDLVPGTYEVTIKKENFKVFRATAVTLTVAQVLPLNAALEPG